MKYLSLLPSTPNMSGNCFPDKIKARNMSRFMNNVNYLFRFLTHEILFMINLFLQLRSWMSKDSRAYYQGIEHNDNISESNYNTGPSWTWNIYVRFINIKYKNKNNSQIPKVQINQLKKNFLTIIQHKNITDGRHKQLVFTSTNRWFQRQQVI